MTYEEYQKKFRQALDDEIKALRKSGGQKTYLSDGSFLTKRSGRYIYSFTADTELRFPDDTPVDLQYQDKKYSGTLVLIEGFDLILALEHKIGEQIATAVLFTSPWFLLEELKKRLEEACYQKGANKKLAEHLLGETNDPPISATGNAQELLNKIEQRLDKPIRRNEHQQTAVDKVLSQKVSFIWGPPGTGKTSTLGITVAALVQAGESVLVVAHSNTAVDTAMKSLAKYLQGTPVYKNGMVLRYGVATPGSLEQFPQLHVRGVARRQNPSLITQIEQLEERRKSLIKQSRGEKLTDLQCQHIQSEIAQVKQALEPLKDELQKKEAELISRATVVGCTLSKAAIAQEVYQRRFDAVVVDEASMAYIPHCAFVSTLANRRVAIFGDFRQLGPISQAETDTAQEWLQRDIFDEAGITQKVNRGKDDSRMVLLKTQYRMYPDISSVPNRLFYNGQLEDGSGVREQTMPIVQNQPCPGHALVLYDLSKISAFCFSEQQSHSRFNLVSALVAVNLAYQSTQANDSSVGIITPYNAQARLIHRLLQDLHLSERQVKAATVHRFQGSEQNLIVFDSVEGSPQTKPGKLVSGGMQSTAMRLSNVAISRAQGKFVGLVNYRYVQDKLDSFNVFRKFIDHVHLRASVQSLTWSTNTDNGHWNLDLPGVTYFSTSRVALEQIKADLLEAKEELAINWPTSLTENHLSITVLRQCNSRNIRFFLTGQGRNDIAFKLQNTHVWDNQSKMSMGLVGIDRKRLWIYIDPVSTASPVLRLDLPQTTKLLYAFLRLVPDKDPGSVIEKIAQGESPFGQCPQCGQPLWPTIGEFGPCVACSKVVHHHKRNMTINDATLWARFMNVTCGKCKHQARAYKSYKGVFLGCTKQDCNWSISLKSLV